MSQRAGIVATEIATQGSEAKRARIRLHHAQNYAQDISDGNTALTERNHLAKLPPGIKR